jgi:hypothetical protein
MEATIKDFYIGGDDLAIFVKRFRVPNKQGLSPHAAQSLALRRSGGAKASWGLVPKSLY